MRRGLDLGLDGVWAGGFSGRLAYTYIRAVTEQTYNTCVGTPCKPATVYAGSYLPAVPMDALYAGLTWSYAPVGFSATVETQARARIYADDRNTAAAGGYWLTNLRMGFEQQSTHWQLSEYIRIDNLADRSYVGSVIVNESNTRYFEPAPGRTAAIMFNAARRN
jgi:iron complex outermembrane receptor protein